MKKTIGIKVISPTESRICFINQMKWKMNHSFELRKIHKMKFKIHLWRWEIDIQTESKMMKVMKSRIFKKGNYWLKKCLQILEMNTIFKELRESILAREVQLCRWHQQWMNSPLMNQIIKSLVNQSQLKRKKKCW